MSEEIVLDVMVGAPADAACNTLVLSGVDLEIPLEMDLDNDPLHDDEVRLLSEDGGYDRVLCASEPDVRPDFDKRLYIYCFRAVPYGIYRLLVRVSAEKWTTVMTDIIVGRKGVRIGDTLLADKDPDAVPEDPSVPQSAPPAEEASADGEFIDFVE
jgi:hypothetical protein